MLAQKGQVLANHRTNMINTSLQARGNSSMNRAQMLSTKSGNETASQISRNTKARIDPEMLLSGMYFGDRDRMNITQKMDEAR